jgi:hypothetical protein
VLVFILDDRSDQRPTRKVWSGIRDFRHIPDGEWELPRHLHVGPTNNLTKKCHTGKKEGAAWNEYLQ